CVIWAPTQNPGGTQATGARLAGLPPEKVTVHTTLLGGGFGRRGEVDFITDAVETAKAVGAPVKVMWTREDDITHGFYRPATYNSFRAALDANGMPAAWRTRMVGPGILIQKGRAKAGAARQGAPPQGGARAGGHEGELGGAAPARAWTRHRRRLLLRQLRRYGGRGVGRRGRRRPRPSARRRDRSRPRGQSRPGQGA